MTAHHEHVYTPYISHTSHLTHTYTHAESTVQSSHIHTMNTWRRLTSHTPPILTHSPHPTMNTHILSSHFMHHTPLMGFPRHLSTMHHIPSGCIVCIMESV